MTVRFRISRSCPAALAVCVLAVAMTAAGSAPGSGAVAAAVHPGATDAIAGL
jgi:hypothetical protein